MQLELTERATAVIRRKGGVAVVDLLEPFGWGKKFEVSVDTRTKGRRLDGYRAHHIADHIAGEVTVLVDPDLQRLAVEVTVVAAGLLRRGLGADVDGVGGAPCPIQLVR